MKKAFTIVELLMVIGIIGVLTGIVTTAASGAVKNSRARRTEVLCKLVEAGINTYHAQHGRWPQEPPAHRPNYEGRDETDDPNVVVLSGSETKDWIYQLVYQTKAGSPVMDVSGLFVSRDAGRYGQRCYGLDFMHAIRGTKKTSKRMGISEMHFGYPDTGSGYFRHFKIVYSHASDSVKVSKMDSSSKKAQAYE